RRKAHLRGSLERAGRARLRSSRSWWLMLRKLSGGLAEQPAQGLGLLSARAAAGQVGLHGGVLVVPVGEGSFGVLVELGEAVVAGQVGAGVGQQAADRLGAQATGWSGHGVLRLGRVSRWPLSV